MARRRKSSKRAAVRGFARKKGYRRSGGSSGLGGFVPLTGREMMLDFGIGAAVGPLSQFLAPYQQQYLGMFGSYSDEAALAIVGAVAHKYGDGIVKDAGKELFRVAVISAGQQAGGQLMGTMTATTPASSGVNYL